MRTKVRATGRTWLLVILAAVAAAVITYLEQARRERERAAEPPAEVARGYEVEVELDVE